MHFLTHLNSFPKKTTVGMVQSMSPFVAHAPALPHALTMSKVWRYDVLQKS
jgi:hypothetical protein